MVKVVDSREFVQNTMGGRPCQLDLSIYDGLYYECGCGEVHCFHSYATEVMREIPMLKIVIYDSHCGYGTLVKIKGFFKYRLESLLSTSTKTIKKKKTKKKKKK